MKIDKKLKFLKRKLLNRYGKYEGQILVWSKEKISKLNKKGKGFQEQYQTWGRKLRRIIKLYKNKLSRSIKRVFKRKELQIDQTEDLLNRHVYAKKIAETIEKRHSNKVQNPHEDKNMIFAISGKWGCGKTRVLELLEPLLVDKGFKVVWFDTWSYSQEPISLKRAFLKALDKGLDSHTDLSSLEQDLTEPKFSPTKKWVILILLATLLFFAITVLLFAKDHSLTFNMTIEYLTYLCLVINKIVSSEIAKLLVIPITLFLLTDVFTLKQTTSRVSTADEFRSKFDEIVKDETKVVVFVDDLDRCTPEIVKQILDALITFFKNDKCSFVVTGDHTVIERYIGSQLNMPSIYLPDGNKDEKKSRLQEVSEGRRFLKKLFDIYWQIPAPEPVRFKEYVGKEIVKLDIKNLDEVKQKQLVDLLAGFLEPNPRAVIRFLTALNFNLETLAFMIEEKGQRVGGVSGSSKELVDIELKGLEEVVKEPALLAKVLLIQELFYPLYEELVQQPDALPLHEKEIRKNGDITTNPNSKNIKDLLVRDEDLGLYKELLRTPPKFTDENGTIIFNADKFLYLSGFTGLPSQKGPDEEWFLQSLKTAIEAKDLIANLDGVSDGRQKQLLTLSQKALDGSTEVTEKQNIAKNMAEIILDVDAWSDGFGTLVNKLVEASFINGIEPIVRTTLSKFIFQHAFEKDINIPSFFSTAPWDDTFYIPVRWEAASQARSLSKTTFSSFVPVNDSEFATNENDAMVHIKILAEKSNQDEPDVQTLLQPLFDKVVSAIFTKPSDQQRLPIIQNLIDIDMKKLSKEIFIQKQMEVIQGVNSQNEIQFLLDNQQYLRKYFEEKELKDLRKVGIDLLRNKSLADWSPLADVLLANQSWEESEKNLVLDALFNHLQNTNDAMYNYAFEYLKKPEIRKFVPSIAILDRFMQVLTTIIGDDRKVTLLDYLNKSNWMDIGSLNNPDQNILISLAKEKGVIGEKGKEIIKSWGIKIPTRKRIITKKTNSYIKSKRPNKLPAK